MSDWAMYEPAQSSSPQPPEQLPTMLQHAPQQGDRMMPSQQPHQLAGSKQPQHDPATKNVPVPPKAETPSKWQDISEYENVYDWLSIVIAVICIEVLVIFLVRFFPDFFGKSLNVWYNRFKLSAVLADILIILVGFGITRYIYSEYIYPTYDWNPLYFTGTALGVQLVHDVLFYLGILKQVPRGSNGMIDTMKEYAEGGGYKILAGDAAMVAGSSVAAMLLKAAPVHINIAVALVALYALPYILETNNGYSTIS